MIYFTTLSTAQGVAKLVIRTHVKMVRKASQMLIYLFLMWREFSFKMDFYSKRFFGRVYKNMKLGFISDIHEDIKRLKQALSILRSFKCDKIICLGDIVGYSVPYYDFLSSRNSSEVIRLLRKKSDITIVGNHDLFAIKKLPKYKAEFKYPKNWYSLDYWQRESFAKDKIWLYENNELSALLTKKDKIFIDKLPEFFVGNFGEVRIFLSHYAYPDLVGTTKFEPKTIKDVKEHFKFMQKFNCKFGISGHDHKEGIMRFTIDRVDSFGFGKVKIDKNIPTWIHIPSIAKGSFVNGVVVFDTESFVIELISLSQKGVTTLTNR